MLEQLSRHSLIDLTVTAKGDLHIDPHHTTEDTGIAIGEAVAKALGDRKGITRYGHAYIPMDETLTRVALDLSNRPYLIWKVEFTRDKLGEMDTELFSEWFQAFAFAAGCTLHVENLYGLNNHHIVETCFKGAGAGALKVAIAQDPRQVDAVPSTKGVAVEVRMEIVAIVDCGSGNLRSAAKAFERAASDLGLNVDRFAVTSDPDVVRRRSGRASRPRRFRGRVGRACGKFPGFARPWRRSRSRRRGHFSASASACS